jgi:chromosome segregation ATPase
MSKVYESLKEVMQGTLQLSKVNSNPLARVKGTNALPLNKEMEELERFVVDRTPRLKTAVTEGEALVAGETRHAAQVIQTLTAKITALEGKLSQTEDTVRQNDLASQRMEESITRKIQDLQSEIKKKETSLASRGNEVKDLKSKIDVLEKQVTQLQQAIQQAKEEAASEAKHVEPLTDASKTKIAVLESELRKMEEIVRGKASAIKRLAAKPYRKNPRLGKPGGKQRESKQAQHARTAREFDKNVKNSFCEPIIPRTGL